MTEKWLICVDPSSFNVYTLNLLTNDIIPVLTYRRSVPNKIYIFIFIFLRSYPKFFFYFTVWRKPGALPTMSK